MFPTQFFSQNLACQIFIACEIRSSLSVIVLFTHLSLNFFLFILFWRLRTIYFFGMLWRIVRSKHDHENYIENLPSSIKRFLIELSNRVQKCLPNTRRLIQINIFVLINLKDLWIFSQIRFLEQTNWLWKAQNPIDIDFCIFNQALIANWLHFN